MKQPKETSYYTYHNGNARIEVERCGAQLLPAGTTVYFLTRKKGKMQTGKWVCEIGGTIFVKVRRKEYRFYIGDLYVEKGVQRAI